MNNNSTVILILFRSDFLRLVLNPADEQFLVQISSAPGRSKLSTGPARLHVLERRFCLTEGVPPRLVGHWLIAQLRYHPFSWLILRSDLQVRHVGFVFPSAQC